MAEITVIITAYNLEKYIGKCFDELYHQSFQDYDIVVVDDCSRDNTKKIIEQWKARFSTKLKTLFLEDNLGLPALTRNAALDSGLIDGKYILFLDGDDSIESDMLEKLYHAIIKYDADVAICAYDRVETGTGRVLCREMQGFPSVVELPPKDDILAFVNTSPWNKLWKRELFEDGRFPPFKVGEEVALLYTRYSKCRRIAFVDDILIHYKVHEGSVISTTQQETIFQFAEELKNCYYKQKGEYRDCMGLIVFLHIGISMVFRAADNRDIDLREHLKWTRKYFCEEFSWFQDNPYLKIRSLIRHGIKGFVVWCALWTYRVNMFRMVICVYHFASKKLHIDFKF